MKSRVDVMTTLPPEAKRDAVLAQIIKQGKRSLGHRPNDKDIARASAAEEIISNRLVLVEKSGALDVHGTNGSGLSHILGTTPDGEEINMYYQVVGKGMGPTRRGIIGMDDMPSEEARERFLTLRAILSEAGLQITEEPADEGKKLWAGK